MILPEASSYERVELLLVCDRDYVEQIISLVHMLYECDCGVHPIL